MIPCACSCRCEYCKRSEQPLPSQLLRASHVDVSASVPAVINVFTEKVRGVRRLAHVKVTERPEADGSAFQFSEAADRDTSCVVCWDGYSGGLQTRLSSWKRGTWCNLVAGYAQRLVADGLPLLPESILVGEKIGRIQHWWSTDAAVIAR